METSNDKITCLQGKYQPSGTGGTHSPPATPHRLPVGPKMADGVWKGIESVVIGRYRQLLLNKFSYPSTPCISTNQRPRNPKWLPGAPKWPTGSGKGSNPRLLSAPVNFC